jgi:flavodoxin
LAAKKKDEQKILVVYYSLDGNTRFVAKTIAEHIDADILELIPKKKLTSKGIGKYIWGSSQILMNKEPELKKFTKDPKDYDIIFIGTPIWWYTFTPPVRTFFHTVKLKKKKIGLFSCNEGNQRKTFERMKRELKGNDFIGEIEFFAPVKKKTEKKAEKQLKKWLKKVMEKV